MCTIICMGNSYKNGGRCLAGIKVNRSANGYNVVRNYDDGNIHVGEGVFGGVYRRWRKAAYNLAGHLIYIFKRNFRCKITIISRFFAKFAP